MKRLLFFALIAYTAWYGWNHRDMLTGALNGAPHSEAVLENASGHPVTRLRLTAGGKVTVREALAVGESATLQLPVQASGDFVLQWQWGDQPGERTSRIHVAAGEGTPQRYRFRLPAQGEVDWSSAPLVLKPAK